jgi:tight adherence protein B
MNFVLLIVVFLIATAFFVSAIHYFIMKPLSSKRAISRLESMQQFAAPAPEPSSQDQMLREDVLSDNPALNRFLRQIPLMINLHLFVKQSALGISVARLLSFSLFPVAAILFLGLAVGGNVMVVLIIAAAVGAIPFMVVAFYRQKRFARFEELLPEAIDLLARSVRAGHAFTSGLEMIADEMAQPLSGEFRRVFEQQNLGLSIREALQNLVLRVPLPDVRVFVTALIIQRETGGNLAEILGNLSNVVRERFRLMRHIRAVTAQGRLSRNILMAVPPGMGFLMYLKNPDYIMMLFTDPRGRIMLYAAIAAQVIGFFMLQKIIKPKV